TISHVPLDRTIGSTSLLLLFFFSSYADHRDLHSFPTRRSSDLITGTRALTRRLRDLGVMRAAISATGGADTEELRQRVLASPQRSEEHTSELQSRFDLVCRLLLEKKKKKKENQRNRKKNYSETK